MTFTAIRVSPDLTTSGAPCRRSRLERTICIALALGVVVQVMQRQLTTGFALSEYGRSLWYVNYEFGFVRRGLAGEVLRTVSGTTPSLATVDLLQNVIAGIMLAATALVVYVLCRQRTIIGYAAAAVLVVSPFAFDFIGGQRRPDLFGFLLLAAFGIWAAFRDVRATALGLIGGALLAVATLVSEVSALIVGPWLILVVAAAARAFPRKRSTPWLALCLASVPSVVTLAVLTMVGRASPEKVSALEQAAPPEIRGHGSIFSYLGDTFRGSIIRVAEGPARLALSIVMGILLTALVLFCARDVLPYARGAFHWMLPTRMLRAAWITGTLAASAVLFALGLDWLRWFTAVGFAALLATAAIVTMTNRSPSGPPDRETWQRPIPTRVSVSLPGLFTVAVGVYLLLLPPLPNWIPSFEFGGRLLLDVPR